ncbi:hypothetical protein ACFY1P_20525 [Streptomyces sp. NPDC001407]|uniref:hypothetical protein n=1 Tax=Streptomyces sp. NPDC001407 TaxID=3364573 RepID=UPI0036B971B8
MSTSDPFTEFLTTVAKLRDDDASLRASAHTSSVSSDAWNDPAAKDEAASTAH